MQTFLSQSIRAGAQFKLFLSFLISLLGTSVWAADSHASHYESMGWLELGGSDQLTLRDLSGQTISLGSDLYHLEIDAVAQRIRWVNAISKASVEISTSSVLNEKNMLNFNLGASQSGQSFDLETRESAQCDQSPVTLTFYRDGSQEIFARFRAFVTLFCN